MEINPVWGNSKCEENHLKYLCWSSPEENNSENEYILHRWFISLSYRIGVVSANRIIFILERLASWWLLSAQDWIAPLLNLVLNAQGISGEPLVFSTFQEAEAVFWWQERLVSAVAMGRKAHSLPGSKAGRQAHCFPAPWPLYIWAAAGSAVHWGGGGLFSPLVLLLNPSQTRPKSSLLVDSRSDQDDNIYHPPNQKTWFKKKKIRTVAFFVSLSQGVGDVGELESQIAEDGT